jgi:Family of unknown function (DUF5683)
LRPVRGWFLAGLVGASALVPAAAARAADPPPARRAAAADTVRHRSPPFRVMLRSAVLPGWGQMYNGKPIKAALVVAGEGLLVYKALDELHKENDAIAKQSLYSFGTPEYDAAVASEERHYNLKVNYIWWAVAVHLLQMADAYVDAHLADFSAEVAPGVTFPGAGRPPGLAVSVRLRF